MKTPFDQAMFVLDQIDMCRSVCGRNDAGAKVVEGVVNTHILDLLIATQLRDIVEESYA